mmetsp:Transcript_4868/g.10194  ORF Transcript_4868/g.10194 Transcript_4868/m.10194 type:complete len:272 (+) Transcript_4868:188-1003(+)
MRSLAVLLTLVFRANADAGDYYASIDTSLADDQLRNALQTLISNRTEVDYDQVWDAFAVIDKSLPGYPCDPNDPSKIPDIYSSYCWTPAKGLDVGGECGNYKKEGDCFNREHSWPKAWWGGFNAGEGAQTDLFELWPSDGYVNGLRGNLPFGNVVAGTETYTSTNGCRIGDCADLAGTKCFEPVDMFKGDLARTFFYLSTLFEGVWNCCDNDYVEEADMKPWMEATLRQWHAADPVDTYEMSRNDLIFSKYQGNRNPFIDHEEWVEQIANF